MKVRFTKDFIYRGKSTGLFMVDYKKGQEVRLPRDHYAQAKAADAVEEIRNVNDNAVLQPGEGASPDVGDAAESAEAGGAGD